MSDQPSSLQVLGYVLPEPGLLLVEGLPPVLPIPHQNFGIVVHAVSSLLLWRGRVVGWFVIISLTAVSRLAMSMAPVVSGV